jgi:hypothetical protein
MSPFLRRVLFALPLLAALGCQIEAPPRPKVVNTYLAERADLANVRRIMVLPFAHEAGVAMDCSKVRDAFVAELQKLRRFEVVPLPAEASEDEELNFSLSRGRLSTDAIVRLCRRYSLDGLFLGSVTSWRAYTPPHLGLRTQLVSVHSGAPVWAVDAIYDAADRSTISDLRHYTDTTQQDDGNLHGYELSLLAPSKFTTYVAHRCVGTWVED